MFAAASAVTLLVALNILLHYEVLRVTSAVLPRLSAIRPRARVIFVVFACFAAHTIEVWLFALAYYMFVNILGLGSFGGEHEGSIIDYVYFSVVTYTSLGFGDISPIDNVRLIAGVEALVGLVMIGWSASFTYLAMEKLWPLHGARRRSSQTPHEPPDMHRAGKEKHH